MKLFDFEKVTRISNTFKYFYINIMVLVSYYDGNEFNYFYYVQARKMKARGGGQGFTSGGIVHGHKAQVSTYFF